MPSRHCDVGTFGPLAQSWKQLVTFASQSLIAIQNDNVFTYYHSAHTEALKLSTIQSAFQKTGIWSLNGHAIPPSAFEPSKNTTTQATQPLPVTLPSILIPTPNQTPTPTPTTSTATATTLYHDADTPVEGSLDGEQEPMEQYHIAVPPPLPGTSSWQAL